MDDKIIVSNRSALVAKYGNAGLTKVTDAVKALIAADAARGIKSRLVFLDDAKVMKGLKAPAVTKASDPRQNKTAIDAIFRTADPEYLMILGARDVVPHQDLTNPMFDPPHDADAQAWGDLPYACAAPYSRDIATFKGPTRVVGRLPDLTGASDPAYLVGLLRTAEKYRSRPVKDYAAYFGLSTASWQDSTAKSLFEVFGESKALRLAPPSGPNHSKARLAPLAHFINCHGGEVDPTFYGEEAVENDPDQPPSLRSTGIKGKIRPGTVAAVECCFGAELYDSVLFDLPLPICQHYLKQGAYGYFGSTTIAYGPAEGNGAADFITQYFLLAVLDGASLGRAALLARQRFVQQTAELDPADLKTLGQFNLLGDPSIHAVKAESATAVPTGIKAADAEREQRRARRAKLRAVGEFLQDSKPTAGRKAKGARRSPTVRDALRNIARKAGIGAKQDFTAFDVKVPPIARRLNGKANGIASRYYVAVYRPNGNQDEYSVAAVAKEVSGRIVGYRIYEEK
jgi:hypothetical protein